MPSHLKTNLVFFSFFLLCTSVLSYRIHRQSRSHGFPSQPKIMRKVNCERKPSVYDCFVPRTISWLTRSCYRASHSCQFSDSCIHVSKRSRVRLLFPIKWLDIQVDEFVNLRSPDIFGIVNEFFSENENRKELQST